MAPSAVDILAIAGSPRRGGNTDRLLDAFIAGAESSGARVERLVVVEAGIGICQGCNSCSKTGECVVQDGMQDVYPKLEAASAIAIATPVYFASVPASLKALYDRCQPYWARRYVLGQGSPGRRPGALLLVGGGGDPYGAEAAVTTTRSALACLGVDIEEIVEVEGPDAPGEIEGNRRALEDAAGAGSRIAQRVLGEHSR